MLSDFIDKILDKLATKYRSNLIGKKAVKTRLDKDAEWQLKIAANSAFEGTKLELRQTTDYWGNREPDISTVPEYYLQSLIDGKFEDVDIPHISRATRKRIQEKFTYGYEEDGGNRRLAGFSDLQENSYRYAARDYLKGFLGTWLVVLIILIGAGVWGLHGYIKHRNDVAYWKQYNTPETYKGDGYSENFPCGGVKDMQLTSDSDLSSTRDSCEYYGGSDHEQIDNYSVEVEHFLTTKYDPAQEMNCPSPTVYTGNPDTQTYYSETRTVDGVQVVICGVGSSPTVARIQQGNTIYTLEALPSVEKTTYSKLNQMIQGFQLNN